MRIKWTNEAKNSLNREISFIEAESKEGARKVYSLVRKQVQTLSQFPHMGRVGQIENTRELVITGTSYLVPYTVEDGIVEIICIFHTSRQLPSKW